jgi:ABC-type spermidine/putrescine transport system permease subunit II
MLPPPPGAAVADGYWFEQSEEDCSSSNAVVADFGFDTSCGAMPCNASSVPATLSAASYLELLEKQRCTAALPQGAVDATHLLSHVWAPTPISSMLLESALEELQKGSIKLGETGLGASGQALLRRVLFAALRKSV